MPARRAVMAMTSSGRLPSGAFRSPPIASPGLGATLSVACEGRLAGGAMVVLAVGRYLESLLYQVSPRNPVAFGVSAAVLVIVSVAACLIPARRATRVNPVDALRFE